MFSLCQLLFQDIYDDCASAALQYIDRNVLYNIYTFKSPFFLSSLFVLKCNYYKYIITWWCMEYIQINTWAFPYWPVYHPETPILARDEIEGQYWSKDDNQANMEMPMY